MLSKKQKIIMAILGSIGILFGLVVAVPFRAIPGLNEVKNILTIELIIKLVLGVLTLLLVIYPFVKKYKLVQSYREHSKTIIVMCYFPIFAYIFGSVVNVIYTLSFDYTSIAMLSTLSDKLLGIVVAVLTVYLVFTIYCLVRIQDIVARLDKGSNILFDSFMLVIYICFVILLWRTNYAYNRAYSTVDEYFVGSPLLFCIYIALFITIICSFKYLFVTIKKDKTLIYYIEGNLFDDLISQAEYNRAYNDTLDDFENYFETNYTDYENLDIEEIVSKTEDVPAKQETPISIEKNIFADLNDVDVTELAEVDEKIELVETDELKEVHQQKDEVLAHIKTKNEALALIREKKNELEQKENDLKAAKDAYDAALAEFTQFKLDYSNVNEVDEKENIKKVKKFTPTFEKVVEYANSFSDRQGFKVNANPKGTLLKFYLGKKMYLVLQATKSDYRISFITNPDKFVEYVTSRPGELIVPKNLKDNNWIRLTNKGKEDPKLIRQIIKQAVETAEKQLADAAAVKLAEKKAKAAERARMRAEQKANANK